MENERNNLGKIDLSCDMPDERIVIACKHIKSLIKHLDVRWLRWENLPDFQYKCSCGNHYPELTTYKFTFTSRHVVRLGIGQCSVCKTIYWTPRKKEPGEKEQAAYYSCE